MTKYILESNSYCLYIRAIENGNETMSIRYESQCKPVFSSYSFTFNQVPDIAKRLTIMQNMGHFFEAISNSENIVAAKTTLEKMYKFES